VTKEPLRKGCCTAAKNPPAYPLLAPILRAVPTTYKMLYASESAR